MRSLAFAVTALVAYRLYKRSEPDLLVRGARELLAKKDYAGAILDARRALQINPASADACRIIASILEGIGNTEAIDWRRRVLRWRFNCGELYLVGLGVSGGPPGRS